MSDFDLDGLFLEPRPDEDAWEAFVNLALERIGGDRAPGLTNREIGELEAVLGCMLPFEVGLLLVMGVPEAEPWRQWLDPEVEWKRWNDHVVDGICLDIEEDNFWFDGWGAPPASAVERVAAVREEHAAALPPLFPIYGNHAVPLTTADGQVNSDGNPVISVHRTEVVRLGDDLAAWMHKEFDVPLPMWPSEERTFPFWSELSS